MKRTIAVVLLLVIVCMFLVGCQPKFDMDQTIEKLKANGFVVKTSWTNLDSTASYNINGVKILIIGQTFLDLDGAQGKYVKFEVFENEELAKIVYDHMLENLRSSTAELSIKISYFENITVTCNYEPAMEIIGLKFEN